MEQFIWGFFNTACSIFSTTVAIVFSIVVSAIVSTVAAGEKTESRSQHVSPDSSFSALMPPIATGDISGYCLAVLCSIFHNWCEVRLA
ncbi:MAG: hypothetical protein ACJA2Q_002432 [Pseudohongiellaceae bacterium]